MGNRYSALDLSLSAGGWQRHRAPSTGAAAQPRSERVLATGATRQGATHGFEPDALTDCRIVIRLVIAYRKSSRSTWIPLLAALEDAGLTERVEPRLASRKAVAEEFEGPADTVSDDRAAQVADVHLLGDIGAGKVNDDGLGISRFVDTETIMRVGIDLQK